MFLASNIGAPPSLNFVGEVLVGGSFVKVGLGLVFFVGISIFMRGFYNFYLFSLTVGVRSFSFNNSGRMRRGEILVGLINLFMVFFLFLFSSYMF